MQENNVDKESFQKSSVLKKFSAIFRGDVVTILISLLVVCLGVFAGWFLAGGKSLGGIGSSETTNTMGSQKNPTEAGEKDESKFSQSAEGILREGGIKGEGTHYLERTGGISQNAYMVSTSLDLSPFVGKKVKVWGETISGVNTGWLLDVGKIRVIE